MPKRSIVIILLAAALYVPAALADSAPFDATPWTVWKSPDCSCCMGWFAHMRDNGFAIGAKNVAYSILDRIRRQAGIPPDFQSCHTARIGGYVIEGHVPAGDVRRLLAEKPDAIGLAVPGMPPGSPGMGPADGGEPYEVLLVKKDGSTETFAKH